MTFLDGEVKRSWVEEFSLDLSASNHVEIPKNVEEHVRDLQFKQPVRCVCGQLLVLAAFLWFQHQSTKNPYNLGFLWTRLCLLYSDGLLHLYVLSMLSLVFGIYLCGNNRGEVFVAFQWGSFTRQESGEWEYAYWRDLCFWGWYECLCCILLMFIYCLCHVKRPVFKATWKLFLFNLIEWVNSCIPVVSVCVLWLLLFLNVPLNVFLLSFNFTWLPLFVVVFSFSLCHQRQVMLLIPDDKLIQLVVSSSV